MKISKHLHSCLLVEHQNKTILIDPGIFTATAKALDLHSLHHLDYLLFTHEHPDHLHMPFVQEIVHKFPKVTIITNPAIVTLLAKENIKATSKPDSVVTFEKADHERLWDKLPPSNISISVFNRLTHVGDSLHFTKSCEMLALPITAPWGSTTQAVKKALAIKPKYIIPTHDWMWKDEVRMSMYQRLSEFFQTKGIVFKGLETGEILTLED